MKLNYLTYYGNRKVVIDMCRLRRIADEGFSAQLNIDYRNRYTTGTQHLIQSIHNQQKKAGVHVIINK